MLLIPGRALCTSKSLARSVEPMLVAINRGVRPKESSWFVQALKWIRSLHMSGRWRFTAQWSAVSPE